MPTNSIPISQKLLQACRTVLEQGQVRIPGSESSPPRVEDWMVTVFAAQVAITEVRNQRRLEGLSSSKLVRLALGRRSHLRTLLAVAERASPSGEPPPGIRLSTMPGFLLDSWESMEAFRLSVHPTSLSVVLADQAVFSERLDHFLHWYSLGRRQWLPRVKRFLLDAGLTQFDIKHLMLRVPKARWPSYSNTQLREVVERYNAWNQQFRYMRDEALQPGSSVASVERSYEGLRHAVINIVRKRFQGQSLPPTLKPNDAAAWAMSSAVEIARKPGKGYCYRGSLLYYLVKLATTYIFKRLPREWRIGAVGQGEGNGAQVPGGSRGIRDLETYVNLASGAYALSLLFFQKDLQPRVRVIREQMIRNTGCSDEAVARAVTQVTGVEVSANLIAKTRERLLRRMAAVYFIYDTREGGIPPGDAELLAWLKEERGLPKNEIPTIRHLAALSRASLGDSSLGLALLSTLLVDRWQQIDSATAKLLVREELECAGRFTPEIERRLDAAISFTESRENRKIIQTLKSEARGKHLGFLVSPVFCLALLHDMPAHEVVATLLPRADERLAEEVALIEQITARLREGGGLDG